MQPHCIARRELEETSHERCGSLPMWECHFDKAKTFPSPGCSPHSGLAEANLSSARVCVDLFLPVNTGRLEEFTQEPCRGYVGMEGTGKSCWVEGRLRVWER